MGRAFPTRFCSCLTALSLAAAGLAGCNAIPGVPESQIGGDYHDLKKKLFYAVVRGVQCEIRQAVAREIHDQDYGDRVGWLKGWSAMINLKFTIDRGGSFNPGATFITPMINANTWLGDGVNYVSSQGYSLGIGGGVNLDAQRIESVSYFVPFDGMDFNDPNDYGERRQACYKLGDGMTITGDLELYEWLDDVLEPFKKCAFFGNLQRHAGSSPGEENDMCDPAGRAAQALNVIGKNESDNPIAAFQHEIQFKVVLSGSVTPTWKLVRIASPTPNATLASAQQQFTSDLIMVLGPPDKVNAGAGKKAKPKAAPSEAMKTLSNAAVTASYINNINVFINP